MNCFMLQKVTIPNDSKMEEIEDNVFNSAQVLVFIVPPKVKIIKKGHFTDCSNFYGLGFGRNSELATFESNAFTNTLMEEVCFLQNLENFSGKTFVKVPLNYITISKKNKNLSFLHQTMVVKKADSTRLFLVQVVLMLQPFQEILNTFHLIHFITVTTYKLSFLIRSLNSFQLLKMHFFQHHYEASRFQKASNK